MKRNVQENIKRQNYQTSVKNLILMSAETVSIEVIPVVNQKRSRLYDIFAMKVAFSGFYFIFFYFFSISILPVLKCIAFNWCEESVIVVQKIL